MPIAQATAATEIFGWAVVAFCVLMLVTELMSRTRTTTLGRIVPAAAPTTQRFKVAA